MNIYLVVSLPRTGTTSLCEMAKICGIKNLHVLSIPFISAIDQGYGFFADTPFYSPEFLLGLLETNFQNHKYKFIYAHRDDNEWSKSINKLYEKWPVNISFNDILLKKRIVLLDKVCHRTIKKTPQIPSEHYKIIKNICSLYHVPMLDYRFSDGWESFCNFTHTNIPQDIKIPHKNAF